MKVESAFFPSFAQLSSLLKIKPEILDSKRKVAIAGDILKELISRALLTVPFDEKWYLSNYPDLRHAWENGQIKDLKEHFITRGYFEGRSPSAAEFDEKWYLKTYPDIREAVAKGKIESAETHYNLNGQMEWRAPNAGLEADVLIWSKLASPL